MASPSDISQCLQLTLSSDTNARISAELKLAELLAFPGLFIVHYIFVAIYSLTGLFGAFDRCWIGLITHSTCSGCRHVFTTDECLHFLRILERVLMALGALALRKHCTQEVRDGAMVTLLFLI